ncbi:MAG TPA: APC family permease [Actinomycetota bacterium]|nr:APC family permease [Actinomycetota bacterium]
MAREVATGRPQVFERKATGLVREAGTLDTLIYNVNFVSLGLMTALVFLFSTAFYPGANLYLTAILTFLLVIPTSLVFAFFAASMPRSGGDYVYVSRTLHPALGMMSNWNNTVWWFIYGGVPSAFFAQFGLAPLFSTVGQMAGVTWMSNLGSWFASDIGTFLTGTALIVALVAVFSRSLGLYFRIQNTVFFLSLTSLLLTAIVWATQSRGELLAKIGQGLGQNVQRGLGEAAAEAGFAAGGPFSLKWTILAGTWVYINLVFNQSSAYIGGEVKRASRLQLWSMPIAATLAIAVLLILLAIGDAALGLDTIGQLASTQFLVFTQIAAFGSGSVLIAALILGTFIFQSYTWLPGQILNASRNFLAYSIDGLMPKALGKVHARYHTPVNALILVGAGSIAALAAFVWVEGFATLVGIFGFILGFMVVSIAAMAFPYRQRNLFESSPVNGRFAGVPVMSVVGLLSLLALGIMAWAFLTDPSAGLVGKPGLVWMNVAIFLSGLVIYFVAKVIQRGRGVDISRRFAEIPIE